MVGPFTVSSVLVVVAVEPAGVVVVTAVVVVGSTPVTGMQMLPST